MERYVYRPIDEFLGQFILTDMEKDVAEYLIQSTLRAYQIMEEIDLTKSEYHRYAGNILASCGAANRMTLVCMYSNFLEDKFYSFQEGTAKPKYYYKAQ